MKQTLHIFAKDIRIYWLEILATLTVTALFVWAYPISWRESPVLSVWPWVPGAITGLLPVSWLVVITRVIHAESLVGERQFWITRPYRWPQLLAAKVLFVLAFIYVPFFLAQCLLLRQAGMRPSSQIPGLLFNLLLTTGCAVLPMACLAAVTSNFGKTLLALLGLVLFGGGVAYIDSLTPASSGTDFLGDEFTFIVAVSVFLAVLFIQYSRRSTMLAWSLLIALAVTLAFLGLIGPEDFAVKATYPETTAATGPHLAFGQPLPASSTKFSELDDSREVTLNFPIAISGIAPNTAVRVDNAKVSLTGADGSRWISRWQNVYLTLLPGESEATVALKINRAFYSRSKDKPLTAEMSITMTLLKAGGVNRFLLPADKFELPGGTVCRTPKEWEISPVCLSPMRQPKLMLLTTRFSKERCSSGQPSNDGDSGVAWVGTLDTQPADFGLTSVWDTSIWFQQYSSEQSSRRQHLCPGSQISVVPYVMASRNQQTIWSQPLKLNSLVPSGL